MTSPWPVVPAGEYGVNQSHIERIWKAIAHQPNIVNTVSSSSFSQIHNIDNQSLQFTVNKIIYKIFGPIAKDSYCEIGEYFGISTVEHLITNRHDRVLNRFRCQENYVCQTLIM